MAEPVYSAQLKVTAESMPLPTIPEHELLQLIGKGGSGQVWLARNALGTYRAVKMVGRGTDKAAMAPPQELAGVRKFEPVSRLHDGLMDILQVGNIPENGCFYCVMELADDVESGQVIVPERYVPRTLA